MTKKFPHPKKLQAKPFGLKNAKIKISQTRPEVYSSDASY